MSDAGWGTHDRSQSKQVAAFQTVRVAITRIRSTPAVLIGYVQAPDAEQAVKEAIVRYGISNPQEQARLAAQRVKEIG
jgi:hypothetical protein